MAKFIQTTSGTYINIDHIICVWQDPYGPASEGCRIGMTEENLYTSNETAEQFMARLTKALEVPSESNS